MSLGHFHYPMPANEPVLQYAPGSPERAALKKALAKLKQEEFDIPMFIGGKEKNLRSTPPMRLPIPSAISMKEMKRM